MKRTVMTIMALVALFYGIGAFAAGAENSPIRSKKIKLPQVEEQPMFQTRNACGQIKATYLDSTPTRVKLKMPRGDIQEIPMFFFGSPPIHYFLSKMAKIPETVTDHQMEPGRRKLISLDASKMKLGKVKEWKNTGALKGGFIPMNIAPTVVDFEGQRGIKFDRPTQGAYAEPEFEALTSTFTLTDTLGYEAPFTMSALIHCPEVEWLDTTPIMTWGALCGDQQTTLNLGTSEIAGLSAMDGKGPNGAEGWYYMTYVYTGGPDGTLSIYRNGDLISEHQYDVKIERRPTTDITATSATLNAELFSKSGTGSTRLYYGEEDHFQWYQLRHVWWDGSQVLNGIPAGDATFELKDLKPGTKYYYRYAAYDMPKDNMGYDVFDKRRWSYGPGMFETASADGKTPGHDIKNDTRQHFFIGANRGVRWFMKTPGPSVFFKGVISKINVYDYAMGAFEVRGELGMTAAFKPTPEEGADLSADNVDLAWKAGKANVSFRVWIGDDKDAVEAGTVKSYDTQEPKLFVKGTLSGAKQYWRVAQLDKDGKQLDKGDVWSYQNTYGRAHSPRPTVDELVNPTHVLHWEGPIQAVKQQRVLFAKSPEELEAKAAKGDYLYKGLVQGKGDNPRNYTIWVGPTMDTLNPGNTFYWRVDFVYDDDRLVKGPLWNFTVRDYFTPEIDTVWTKPSFDHDPSGGTGCKQSEERVGFPARSSATSPGQVMIDDETTGFSRFLYKSRKLRDYQEFVNGCAKLGYVFDGPSFGRGFSMAYGGLGGDRQKGEAIYGWNAVMHEFGHHLDCSPSAYAKDHGQTKRRIYEKCIDTNKGLGGYGGANQGEEMAMAFHEMTFADKREGFYNGNPELYNLIRQYIGGDRYIDLDPRKNMATDADAKLLSWGNAGGLIKFYGDKKGKDGRRGYGYVDNTQGTFTPVGDPIESVQVGGVAGVKLDGKSALLWNERTKLGLYGNRDFGADFWVRKMAGTGDAVIAALTGKDGKSFRFKWSDFPGATEGVWQHLAYTYEGGGDTHEEAGLLRMFVNEKEVASRQQTFDLPQDARLSVGGWVQNAKAPAVTEGFAGELGQVRLYNYDISMDEVEEHFREESPHYFRTPAAVAEKLYVDIDCRRYEDMPQHTHEPFHPENIRKPWLRSWANFGTLGGRIHNDVDTFMWEYAGSTPLMRRVDGATVPVFMGKDRMVSGFKPNAEAVKNPPRTLELWVKRDEGANFANDVREVALEWGTFQLTGKMLDEVGVKTDGKWHHVVVVFPKPTTPAAPRYFNWGRYKKAWLAGQTVQGEDRDARKKAEQKLTAEMDKRIADAAKANANYEAEIFVDGKAAGKANGLLRLIERDRLNLGGHYDFDFWNWKHYFNGAFSAIRVHKGALTPAQIQANAASKPQDEDKTVPVELVFDITAENLPEGKLSEWTYTGSGGGTFKPGEPVLINQPKVMELNKNVGLHLGGKLGLVSSFDVPEAMRKGPFTILTYTAKPVSQHGESAPILRWDGKQYSLIAMGWNPNGKIFNWRAMEEKEGQKPRLTGKNMNYYSGKKHPLHGSGKQYYQEPTTHNNNAHMEWVWKTKCLTYDGKTLRWIVDGKLEREEATTIYTEPTKPDQKPREVLLTIGGGGRGKAAGVLNTVTIYDTAFSVAELEKATTVVKRKPLKGTPIIDVDFGTLKPGSSIFSIKNTGTLGGEFRSPDAVEKAARKEPLEYAPTVKTEDGVRVVAFDGKDNFLESEETAQRTMTDNEPFTFAAFVKDARGGHMLTVAEKAGFSYSNGGLKVEGLRRQSRPNGLRGQPRGKVGPWVHVACVYEGSRKPSHIYVDGKRVSSVYWSAYFARPDFQMKIGKEFGGGIARMQMWRGVLSDDEIANLAEAAHERVVVAEAKKE
ncbi:MAG: hypothetical protein HN919_13430 [Verrucomicrobia bacterium]|nr:hypothetical protein [Verrucomicrobiota bacterium]